MNPNRFSKCRDLMKSYVCRSGGEMVDRAEYWRAAFEVKGWT